MKGSTASFRFTDTTKTGVLNIPEDATARVLLVGGGAGGLGSYGKSGATTGYGSNGGDAGSVLEKKLADGFILPKGDYTITVGAGGAGTNGWSTSGTYWVGNNSGSDSRIAGGGIEDLVATGGAAFSGNDPSTKPVKMNTEGASQPDKDGAVGANNSENYLAYYAHNGNGAGKAENWDQTGVKSDISGIETTYGVGGNGGATSDNSSSWKLINGANATPANSGNAGSGGSNGGTGGTGASGIVIVRLTYTDPVYPETCEVAPLIKGDQLSTRLITLVMTNAEGNVVNGSVAWKDPTETPTLSGDQTIVFTPEDTTAYAITELTVFLPVVVDLEPSETLAVTDEGEATATKTETASADWQVVVSVGKDYIYTPTTSVDADNRLTVTVKGKEVGVAYVDLYDGATFVKRIIVAVLTDPTEGSQAISVEEDDTNDSVTTEMPGFDWNCVIRVGSQRVTASVAANPDNTATLTVTGVSAGTAIIDILDDDSLVKRAMVTVVGPTEGRSSVVVAEGGSTTVKTTATIDHSRYFDGDESICTASDYGTATKINGVGSGDAELRFYSSDGTLVKIVSVLVVDSLGTYTWHGQTIKYYGAAEPTTVGSDLLFAFADEAGALELPANAVADVLVVSGGGSGVGAGKKNSTENVYFAGNGGGGGKAVYSEDTQMPQGAYVLTVGRGGPSVAKPADGVRLAPGRAGGVSYLSNGADFNMEAAAGSAGQGGFEEEKGTPTAGVGGAEFECSITGSSVTYGINGAGAPATSGQAGADGTIFGQGGQGGYNAASGAGKEGVIYVRLKGFIETPVVGTSVTGTLTYGQTYEDTVWAGAMTNAAGVEVEGEFKWDNPSALSIKVADSGNEYDVVFTPNDTTFYLTTVVKGQLIVNPSNVTVYAVATNKVYGAEDPKISYTVEPALLAGDTLTGALERDIGEDAMSYDLNIGSLANENYELTLDEESAEDAFTITKKPITVTPVAGQQKKQGEAYTITYTSDPATLVGEDKFTGALAAADTVGDQVITIGTLAIDDLNDGKNYDLTFTSGVTIKVNPAIVLVTVVPATVANATATVYTNGVEVAGEPVQVVTNAAFEIVYETDGDHMFSDLTTVKTNKFTATENPMTDSATFEVVGRVAQIGDVKYTSINDVFATLTNNVGHDVTVKILRDFDEVLTNDYLLANNVTITTDVEGGVTVDFGFREGKDVFGIDENLPGTLTITENVAIKGLGQLVSGYGTIDNVVNIAGDLTAGQVWAYKGIVNVLPTAKVVATYGKGDVSIYNSGTVNVEGTGTNEVQVQGISFLGKNKGDKSFVLSNTFVKVQYLLNAEKEGNFTLNLDSARFEADGDKGMNFGTKSVNTINMTADSFIATSNLTNLATNNIDATGLKGAVKVIDILGSQTMTLESFGKVNVTGGGEAYVVDNDLWVKTETVIPVPTAISGLTYNGNVQTGVLAGVGYTITGNEARDAGYHFAMAKLEEGYVWTGGSEEDQQINWSIAQKEITLTPDEGQSIIFGKPYKITFKTDVELAEGDTFTGELKPSSEDEGDVGSDQLIIIGSLEIDDGNDGLNYQLYFNGEVSIHIYAASQGVNPTGSDPITVDTEWILKNLPDVDPENEGDVSEAMAVDCPDPNNNPLWVNYVLNTDTNEDIRVVSTQSVNGVFFDLNSLGIRPDSGATVHAMVEFTPEGGAPTPVVEDQELPISITDITESGTYTVSFSIKNETEEDSTTTVTVGNDEVGALVKDGYKSGSARELVSVPWSDLASEDGDITVENFLVTKNLEKGTKLYSLAEGGEYYDAWELSSDKKWTPVKTVKIEGGTNVVQQAETPETATLKCGTGVWVEREDASTKLVFVGATSNEQPKFTPAEDGWTLGSVRGYEGYDVTNTVESLEGDSIKVPNANGKPREYTYKSGAWGYDAYEADKNGIVRKVRKTEATDLVLPAGSGFWYNRPESK